MSDHDLRHIDLGTFVDGVSAIQAERDQLKLDLSTALAKEEELEGRLIAAHERVGRYADQRDQLAALLARCQEKLDCHRDAVLWGDVCAALFTPCAAAPNIAPTSEHKVPDGIASITRSLGRAIVRFNTSEQLNEFYRAAKSALPTERSGQIHSTPR